MDQIGRYKIVAELGRGAMGVVFRALDPSIGREVAIKIIRLDEVPNAEQRAKQRERLFREARSAGILSHPGIVTIYDMAEEGDMAYIAMEFVAGSTLEQILSLKEPLEPARLFDTLRQMAAALDYAHRKGIVHRDIKPANIIVNEAGIAKIADFGIAKISTADQLTQTGLIVGTPNYMAPEQVQGKQVDSFADQYSLAVMAYEMLTGDKPFVAEHLTTLVYQIVCEAPPPAQRLNPTLGPKVEAVLQKGLSKQPNARYPTCTALVEALEAACAATPDWKSLGRGASLNLPTMMETAAEPPPPPKTEPPPIFNLPAPHPREEPEKKSRTVAYLVTLVLLGAAAVGVYYARDSIFPEPIPLATPVQEAAKPAPAKQEPPTTATKTPAEAAPEAPPETRPDVSAPAPQPAPAEDEQPAPPPRRVTVPMKDITRPSHSVEVLVRSQPSGAQAILDGLLGTACITPCSLKASTGEHTISLSHAGFRNLTRSISVRDASFDLPTLTMAQALGTLMLQTDPPGATITIDDKRWPSVTPAPLSLAPGKYRLALEKGSAKASRTIDIRDGELSTLRVPLQ
jgi:serine/threonine protein kinase